MSRSKNIVISLFIYLIFLVVFIPAKVIVALMPLPDDVKIVNVTGTLWRGTASHIDVMGKSFDQINWALNPWTLMLGKVKVDLRIGSKATPFQSNGNIQIGFSGIGISELTLNTNAGFLFGDQRLPFRTQAQGELALHIVSFSQGKPLCQQLQGTALLHHINVNNQFGDFPLGELKFRLGCDQGQIVLTTKESDNRLGLTGSAIIGDGNRYKVAAKLKPVSTLPDTIINNLYYLGQPDDQGYYSINYQGKLPL